jgi:predicted neuraminidase
MRYFIIGVLFLLTQAMGLASINVINESKVFDDNFGVEHGSTVLPLKNGGVLLCWYAGTAEAQRDVNIYCRQKSREGIWGDKYIAVRPGYKPKGALLFKTAKVANVTLVQDSAGIIYMFWSAIPLSGGFSNSRIDYKFSLDGIKWSNPKRIDHNIGAEVKNKPIHLSGDEYILPGYDEFSYPSNYSFHWQMKLKAGEITLRKKYKIPGPDHIQPSIVKCSDELCAYLRNKKYGRMWMSRFNLKTNKWSKIQSTNLPNSNSPGDTVLLSNGQILMVYNDRVERPRSPLSLAVSSDGVNFTKILNLETDLEKDFHYPTLTKDAAGNFHLSYTWNGRDGIKYRMFNEEYLKAVSSWSP